MKKIININILTFFTQLSLTFLLKNMALDYLVKQFFLFDVFFSQVSFARNMLVGFFASRKKKFKKKMTIFFLIKKNM